MKVDRKLMRRFEYISGTTGSTNTMGTMEIVRVTSPELLGFKIYQFTRNHTVMERNLADFPSLEGHVSTTTETVIDFENYSEAMGYYSGIATTYVHDTDFRTNEPTHPNSTISSTTEHNVEGTSL